MKTLGHICKKPNDRPNNWQKKGIVYKVKCKSWSSHTSVSPSALGTREGKNTNPARAPNVIQRLNNMLKQQTMTFTQNMLNPRK